MDEALDYYKEVVFEKYADFDGRARRAEFWYFLLIHILVFIGLAATGKSINSEIYIIALVVYSLFTIIPTFAVTVRRLHDIDKSGWWYCIKFIPIVGSIILIVFLATQGNYGPNRFGEDPIDDELLI